LPRGFAHANPQRKNFAINEDFSEVHYTLFPRLRWEKDNRIRAHDKNHHPSVGRCCCAAPEFRAEQPAKPARKRLPNNLFTCASTIQFHLQLCPTRKVKIFVMRFRIKGLILGGGSGILADRDGQKPFQFMFTWQMQGQPFEEVAVSPEPGAVSAPGRERKVFASNHFRKPPRRIVGTHLAILIYKQPVVY
jgi:hypothetical protein